MIIEWHERDQLMASAMVMAGSLSKNYSIASDSGILAIVVSCDD